ncbi:hypothetical protein JOS77_31145 [Chromobacterium haemolyticum]|nr:hypothetical protein JOS77_31145 [Chromobacterium haemolyticum]
MADGAQGAEAGRVVSQPGRDLLKPGVRGGAAGAVCAKLLQPVSGLR